MLGQIKMFGSGETMVVVSYAFSLLSKTESEVGARFSFICYEETLFCTKCPVSVSLLFSIILLQCCIPPGLIGIPLHLRLVLRRLLMIILSTGVKRTFNTIQCFYYKIFCMNVFSIIESIQRPRYYVKLLASFFCS